jgi:SM-20-related protein
VLHGIAHAHAALIDADRAAATVRAGRVHVEQSFAPPHLVEGVRRDLLKRHAQFQTAASYSSNGFDDVRQALVCDPDLGCEPFFALYNQLDIARTEIGAALAIALAPGMEATYVVYPTGGYYRPHIDSIEGVDEPGTGRRVISYIIYLSEPEPEWAPSDGGALRAFHAPPRDVAAVATGSDDRTLAVPEDGDWEDVLPRSGSLVLFDSKRVWHEVRPTLRERACLVGWMRAAA